jgi:hypothetical protein
MKVKATVYVFCLQSQKIILLDKARMFCTRMSWSQKPVVVAKKRNPAGKHVSTRCASH